MTTDTMMQRYTEYYDRLKARGIKLITLDCPACKQSIETQPAPAREVWDTLSECPHCSALFMKITKSQKAYGVTPEAPAKASH